MMNNNLTPIIPCILLAAGASRRMGHPKQLLSLDGEPLIRRMARLALEAGFSPVWVVLGAFAESIAPTLADLEVRTILNPHWESGMASSLRWGLEQLPEPWEGVACLLTDQPAVSLHLLIQLRERFQRDPQKIVACHYAGSPGVPAIFPFRCKHELLALKGDRGAKSLLRPENELEILPFPLGSLDLDSPEDLKHLQ